VFESRFGEFSLLPLRKQLACLVCPCRGSRWSPKISIWDGEERVRWWLEGGIVGVSCLGLSVWVMGSARWAKTPMKS
jgi:hypothetical protein